MGTTFTVDAVAPVTRALPQRHWREAARDVLGARLDVVSHDALVVVDGAARRPHPLLGAVHLAFAQHRPLRLSPDHVWLTIAQGFAIHVDENALALRARFVRHAGKQILRHQHPRQTPPQDAEEWAACIDGLVDALGQDASNGGVGTGVVKLLRCDFSTTTSIERIASHVTALASFRAFYDYRVECTCGIPTVTLDGTVDDWQRIRARVDVIGEYGCGWWTDPLKIVLDQFVASAEGRVDVDFWKSVYKPRKDYDLELATGWVSALFPYIQHDDGRVERSDAFAGWSQSSPWSFAGLLPASTPTGFARAPLVLEPMMVNVVVYGGFGGIAQDAAGVVAPVVVWGVGEDTGGAAAIDRVLSSPSTTQQQPPAQKPAWLYAGAVSAFYDRCDGLRCADVVVRSCNAFSFVDRLGAHGFADLDDGRVLAVNLEGRPRVFLVEKNIDAMDLEDVVVVANEFGDLFDLVADRVAGDPWPVVGDAYQHVERGNELRRALRSPGDVVRVLDDDEGWQLGCRITFSKQRGQTEALERFWFAVLQKSYGCTLTFDELRALPANAQHHKLVAACRLKSGNGRSRPP